MQKNLKPMVTLIPPKITLPDGLGDLRLNDLLNDTNTEFFKKKNKIAFRQVTPSRVTTIEIETFSPNVITTTKTRVSQTDQKKELLDTIRKMKNNGMKQTNIAFALGISPSYVSRLLKEDN